MALCQFQYMGALLNHSNMRPIIGPRVDAKLSAPVRQRLDADDFPAVLHEDHIVPVTVQAGRTLLISDFKKIN